jgi:uncharacterized membrane protein
MMHAISLLAPLSIPDGTDWSGLILRYTHILAGVTWIGFLYFFNLVNVNFQKEMTAGLDAKSNHLQFTKLMPASLFWFRWGAMFTVLTGFTYFMLFVHSPGAFSGSKGMMLLTWLLGFVIAWVVNRRFIIEKLADAKCSPDDKAPNRGSLVGILETLVLIGMIALYYIDFGDDADGHVFFIAIGGAFGMIMFMNVWMIIWPNLKKVIAWREQFLKDGTAVPPEASKLARRAFLASRTNTWMSLFMLVFMVMAGHGASLWSQQEYENGHHWKITKGIHSALHMGKHRAPAAMSEAAPPAAEPANAEQQKAEERQKLEREERVMKDAGVAARAPAAKPAAPAPSLGGAGQGVASAPMEAKSSPK